MSVVRNFLLSHHEGLQVALDFDRVRIQMRGLQRTRRMRFSRPEIELFGSACTQARQDTRPRWSKHEQYETLCGACGKHDVEMTVTDRTKMQPTLDEMTSAVSATLREMRVVMSVAASVQLHDNESVTSRDHTSLWDFSGSGDDRAASEALE
jgi:hypothetical protein